MGLLILDAWQVSQLQNSAALLELAMQSGVMNVGDLLKEVSTAITGRIVPLSPPEGRAAPAQPLQRIKPEPPPLPPCPACGRGVMEYWGHSSRQAQARVVGCRSCQYSHIEDNA